MTETDSESEADADTTDRTVRGTGEEASLGAIGSSGAEWSGVERSGAEWSGVEQGGGLTPSGGDLKQVQNVVVFKSKRDRV